MGIAIAAVVCAAGPARGGDHKPILIRSHSAQLDADARDYLDAFSRALGQQRALLGASLRDLIEARMSRGPTDLAGAEKALIKQVEDGRRRFIEGKFPEALKLLLPARDRLLAAEGRVASDQRLRHALHTALLMLGHTHLRLKQPEKATEAVSEVVRSIPPGQDLSMIKYAPELVTFFKKVRLQLKRQDRAALRVTTDPAGCLVFLNGRYVGISPVRVADLYPGRYRVYIQRPRRPGRVHEVVMNGADRRLSVNFGLDSVLRTKKHVAFEFASQAELARREVKYATSVARAVGASQAILVGFRKLDSGPVLMGTLVSEDGGRVVRSGFVSLAPAAPSPRTLRSLAEFLLSGGQPPPGVKIQGAGSPAHAGGSAPAVAPAPASAPNDRGGGWMGTARWIALGVAVVGLGVGIPLMAMDGGCIEESAGRCPETYETMSGGVAATAVGGAAAAGAVVLFFLDAKRQSKDRAARAAVVPALLPGGAGVWATVCF